MRLVGSSLKLNMKLCNRWMCRNLYSCFSSTQAGIRTILGHLLMTPEAGSSQDNYKVLKEMNFHTGVGGCSDQLFFAVHKLS